MHAEISVVVPVLNEAANIEKSLQNLEQIGGIKEVIVVDGGSSDNTITLATPYARVIRAPQGRAWQMNAGAREAAGGILLFLHADTAITREGIELLRQLMADPGVVGGCYKLCFDDRSLLFKLIALGSNLRARLGKIYFGDQGIFVRREIFIEINGFPEVPLMEEWGFCRKLRQKGRLVQLPARVTTSSRRWHKYGVWKTILLMHRLKLLYLLGVSPYRLKKLYTD